VQNISNRDAYDLDLSIIQTVTIPDLKHDASLKIDTLKSLQSVPMEIPLQFNPQDNLAPAMKRFPDVENKLRMFVDNPQGLSSSIVEFSVNLGYKIQEIKKAQTQDLEGFEEEVEPRNFLLVIGINKMPYPMPKPYATNCSRITVSTTKMCTKYMTNLRHSKAYATCCCEFAKTLRKTTTS
jgi:hypothetical protein